MEVNLNNKDYHFLKQTILISSQSKDPSTKVGAIIVDPKGRVVSQGRNGFPVGACDTEISRNRKLLRTLHAELNAILFATKDLDGCTIYVSAPPCAQCMAAIIQVGIIRVVFLESSKAFDERWAESCNEGAKLANEAGITYEICPIMESK